MKYKIFNFVLLLIILILFSGCTKTTSQPINNLNQTPSSNSSGQGEKMNKYSFPGVLPNDKIQNKKAVIKTSKGDITIDLYADKAPKTVSNFVYLAELGFYNGLTFHRVESYVVQGGDPTGTGSGGPGYKFPDEPVQGDYIAGSVAMANSGPNTNGSQFFISPIDNSKNFEKLYNLFGQVTAGMDVVKKIQVGDKIESIKIESR